MPRAKILYSCAEKEGQTKQQAKLSLYAARRVNIDDVDRILIKNFNVAH